MNRYRIVPLIGSIMLSSIVGCSTQPPSIPTGDNAQVTNEGLVKVENSRLALSYVRPNIDWTHYSKLYFSPVQVTNDHSPDYKPPKIDPRTDGPNATYQLPEESLTKMATAFHEMSQRVFNAEQPFTLVNKAGANTLIIQAAVTDIRLSAPIEKSRKSYRSLGSTYTQTSGSMLLLAVIKDGETGEVLAKVADRGQAFEQWRQNTQVFNWGDVRTVYRRWLNDFKNALIDAGAK
ncbi:DUF3313 family protein [Shewanella colwelliana]|uniref:DUF3313 family protein n=1 Tax=Shewanella colwelliana TaxID=23 RepID=UPI0004B4C084|nr:DUF3313 family protein [Shewanella colwelliana]